MARRKHWTARDFVITHRSSDPDSGFEGEYGYCRVCKTKHGVYRSGLLVATEVEGLPFSREYEVKK